MSATALGPRPAFGPGAIAARLRDRLDELVPVMGRTYADEIPEYRGLSGTATRDVLATSRRLVELFCVALTTGEEIDDVDLEFLVDVGRRRLEMGISLDAVLRAFRTAQTVAWDELVRITAPDEQEHLAPLARSWIQHTNRAASAMASGYIAASHQHLRRLDAQRRAVVDALLSAVDAGDVAAVAAHHAVPIARTYTPVLLGGDAVTTTVDHLLDVAPDDTLAAQRGHRLLLLVPGEAADAGTLLEASRAEVAAHGRAAAVGSALLAEVQAVEALHDAAVAAGRRGVFGPDDLLFEQLLRAAPRVADVLVRRVLEPLRQHDHDGIFTATLRSYLACGSVPATAAAEHVHPNTVAYRLKRVAAVTGLDPRVPEQAALLVAALRSEDPS